VGNPHTHVIISSHDRNRDVDACSGHDEKVNHNGVPENEQTFQVIPVRRPCLSGDSVIVTPNNLDRSCRDAEIFSRGIQASGLTFFQAEKSRLIQKALSRGRRILVCGVDKMQYPAQATLKGSANTRTPGMTKELEGRQTFQTWL
jgi:hypothetical protein